MRNCKALFGSCVCGIVVFIHVDFECEANLNCLSSGRVRALACFLEDGHALSDCCEHGDETHAHGVVIPDLPGCFLAGDTLEEAFGNSKKAANGWVECALAEGMAMPKPSSIEEVAALEGFKGWMVGSIDVDVPGE